MKFWVVGGEGLVGLEMQKCLGKKGVAFAASSHREADILHKEALEEYYQREQPTHIVNCSAYVDVDGAEGEGSSLAYQVNVEGVVHLAELAKRHRIKLIHIGTDYVFDGEKGGDYVETDQTHPINVYGKTKLEGERRMLEIDPGSVCVRSASLYGQGKKGLVHGIVRGLMEKEVVQHVIDQVSTPTNVEDLVEALFDVKGESGVFHFVNGGFVSREGLVLEVKAILEEKGIPHRCLKVEGITQKESKRRAIRPKRSVLSTKKITPFLTFSIRSWQEALRAFVGEIL